MNYIQTLQAELAAEVARTDSLDRGMVSLRTHLMSEKFRTDTTIQVADVMNWLRDIKMVAQDDFDNAYIAEINKPSKKEVAQTLRENTCDCSHSKEDHTNYIGRVTYCGNCGCQRFIGDA